MQNGQAFSEEQKEYLQGFWSGASAARAALGMPGLTRLRDGSVTVANGAAPAPATAAEAGPSGPERIHWEAQNRLLESGGKLTAEEKAKREKWPFSMWDELVANAKANKPPKGADVFLYKFYGLFWVAPAQDGFMSRLKIPNGILTDWQLKGLADLADDYGGGYSHVTTRGNLQIRQISPENSVKYLDGLFGLGITSRGSGADNIRNITGSATAGIDPQEIYDTRPLAREIQHYILNRPDMFGLPRKFNIAFDGGGSIGTLEESNDIGFTAVEVGEDAPVPPGVYFRLALGGISGHKDLAQDEGVLLRAEECTPVSAAIVRVFNEEGDRSNRHKARLKYVLDRLGHDAFLQKAEGVLGYKLPRFPLASCKPRPPFDRLGHIGVHPQRQDGLVYIGLPLLVGRLTSDQMREIASIARQIGDGDVRLTVWQNLLLSGIPQGRVQEVSDRLLAAGLPFVNSELRSGLVACTGKSACRFGLAVTKETAAAIEEYLGQRIELPMPVNIHITGCPNSCAQHYIGDIGLLGSKVEVGEDQLDAFDIVVGGGWGADANIGRELSKGVPVEAVPALMERMLGIWISHRQGEESFAAFTRRQDEPELRALFDLPAPEAPA